MKNYPNEMKLFKNDDFGARLYEVDKHFVILILLFCSLRYFQLCKVVCEGHLPLNICTQKLKESVENHFPIQQIVLSVAFDLTIVNSLFKKKEEHLVTFRTGSCRTQIDYFLIRANRRRLCKDCKGIPSECWLTRYKLLVMVLVRRISR